MHPAGRSTRSGRLEPRAVIALALIALVAACGATDQLQTPEARPTEETVVEIGALDGSISSAGGELTSSAAFDEAGLQHLRNDLAAWYNQTEDVNTDVGDLDWASEFVLLTVFEACDPVAAVVVLGEETTALDWTEGGSLCESLTPHVALFVVPLSGNAHTASFGPDRVPQLTGAQPIEPIAPVRRGGIKPAGVFVEPDDRGGERISEGVFFFEHQGDGHDELLREIVGTAEDGDPETPGLQAQTDAMIADEEFLLIVVEGACGPLDVELVPTADGFTHTMWSEPVDCSSSPLHAVVYVVPRETADGIVYGAAPDVQPDIAFDTIEES